MRIRFLLQLSNLLHCMLFFLTTCILATYLQMCVCGCVRLRMHMCSRTGPPKKFLWKNAGFWHDILLKTPHTHKHRHESKPNYVVSIIPLEVCKKNYIFLWSPFRALFCWWQTKNNDKRNVGLKLSSILLKCWVKYHNTRAFGHLYRAAYVLVNVSKLPICYANLWLISFWEC